MPTPFTITSDLRFPTDNGEPVASRPASGQGQFDAEVDHILNLTGSGTQAVPFTSFVNGAKAISVEIDPSVDNPVTPINMRVNASTDNIQITPGGHWTYFNPVPASGGVTSLSFVYTTSCKIRVRALG